MASPTVKSIEGEWVPLHTGDRQARSSTGTPTISGLTFTHHALVDADSVTRANEAFAANDFSGALECWTHLLNDVDPVFHYSLHTNIGAALERLGRVDEAIRAYGQALESKPDHAEAYHNRGVALKTLNQLELSLDSFRAALAAKPDFFPSLRGCADILTCLGRYEEAITQASAAVAAKPGAPGPLTDRAFAELKARQLDAALADYRRAIRELGDASAETSKLYAITLSQKAVELDRGGRTEEAAA